MTQTETKGCVRFTGLSLPRNSSCAKNLLSSSACSIDASGMQKEVRPRHVGVLAHDWHGLWIGMNYYSIGNWSHQGGPCETIDHERGKPGRPRHSRRARVSGSFAAWPSNCHRYEQSCGRGEQF